MEQQKSAEHYIITAPAADDFQAFERLYAFEVFLMERIRQGVSPVNTQGIPPIQNDYFLALVQPTLRNLKNQFNLFAAVATERAINGGVDVRIAFLLCGYYQREAENIQQASDIDALAEVMLEDFATRTAKFKLAPHIPGLVRQAVLFIRQNLHRPLRIDEVANHVNRSRSQLDRDFKNSLGISPQAFILQQKIEKAAEFLLYTNASITEISQSFGFSSPSHFCNAFLKQKKMTPSAYRKKETKAI